MVNTQAIEFDTAPGEIIDITPELQRAIDQSAIESGIVVAFVPGSTAGLTTMEYEDGLVADLAKWLEQVIPSGGQYHHNDKWKDGNGYSHLRAALLGPDVTVPFVNRTLILGEWQQVVLVECDNRQRTRRVVFQIMGEQA